MKYLLKMKRFNNIMINTNSYINILDIEEISISQSGLLINNDDNLDMKILYSNEHYPDGKVDIITVMQQVYCNPIFRTLYKTPKKIPMFSRSEIKKLIESNAVKIEWDEGLFPDIKPDDKLVDGVQVFTIKDINFKLNIGKYYYILRCGKSVYSSYFLLEYLNKHKEYLIEEAKELNTYKNKILKKYTFKITMKHFVRFYSNKIRKYISNKYCKILKYLVLKSGIEHTFGSQSRN